MYNYPVNLKKDDNGTILVSFPDFPEAHTFGEDKEDALMRAVDALETILIAYIEDRKDIPDPSAIRSNQSYVELPALSVAKVALYKEMRKSGVRKAELARRLGWHMPQVDRLLDLRHDSRLDRIEKAMEALENGLTILSRFVESRFSCRCGKTLVMKWQASLGFGHCYSALCPNCKLSYTIPARPLSIRIHEENSAN